MEKTRETPRINKNLLKTVLYSAIVWGLLAHGMALFNKYSFHDDAISFNGVGATYESGRWMLGILGELSVKLTGSKNYSLPLVNGTITILCIAAIVYLLIDSLKIQSKTLTVLLCGVMVTFPAVTGAFGFMFTAPYYYFGALMGVVGAWIFHQKKTIWAALICMVLMACATGVYQANISVCICTLLLYMIDDIWQSAIDWKSFWKMALCNAAVCVGFITEYFLINQYFLSRLNTALTDYQGINNFGKTSLSNYIVRLLCAYGSFFYPSTAAEEFNARYVYTALTVIAVGIAAFALWQIHRSNAQKTWQMALILIAYPVAACFIYLMVESWTVHSLMTFGQTFTFVLAAWFMNKCEQDNGKTEKVLCNTALVLLGVLVVLNIRYSNVCYLKADITQEQKISYYTTLITRIESMDGYTADDPLVYIGEYNKETKNLSGLSKHFDELDSPAYRKEDLFNGYTWKEEMELWCGFAPELGDSSEFEGNAEVAAMPCYPDQGSIRRIDGKIVVKFADEQ